MELPEKIQGVIKDSFHFAKGWKSRNGQRIIGILLPDVPEELIYAAGMLPFTILSGSKNQSSTGIIPSFACSLISNTFDQAFHGELRFLDGVVIPYLCDSSRALFQIWERNFSKPFSELIRLPKKLDSQRTKTYLIEELRRFKQSLEGAFGINISNEKLWQSIGIYNENRRYLKTIQALRCQNSDFMSNYDFFSLVKSSMLMPKIEHNNILKEIIAHMKSSFRNPDTNLPVKIFLSGKLIEPLEIFKWMDDVEISATYDDLAVGSRYFSYEVKKESDALSALADSYFVRIPHATVVGTGDRLSYILEQIRENDLKGVIFIHLKFCEPLVFDYPDLKKGLDQRGIPNLLLETQLHSFNEGQIRTRLQAFSEILRSKE